MALSYFSKLPIIEYPFGKTGDKKARDILHRLFFDQKFMDQSDYVRKYTVKDGDRPEIISYSLYRRSDLHTLVMLFNEFDKDNLYAVPIFSTFYDEYLNEKYSDEVYYLIPTRSSNDLSTLSEFGRSGGYVFPMLGYGFTLGEKIFGTKGDFIDDDVYGYVKEWNPIMSALKVDMVKGSFADGATVANSNASFNFKVSYKTRGRDAVHHFEAANNIATGQKTVVKGTIIDPLSRISLFGTTGINITPIGFVYQDGVTSSYANSLIYRFNTIKGTAQELNNISRGNIKAVSFQQFEEMKQEKKRIINVPAQDPSLLGTVIANVSEILKNTTESAQ